MYRPHIRGRNRLLTQPMKVKLCEMVAESSSIEEAAEALDVSVRTVQRERKEDEDFDHELRLSLQSAPDPKKLMDSAARTHWRAAAWLLERTDPERYGRRPVNSASPQQVEAALRLVTEAALMATPPERQNELYDRMRTATDHAFKCLFPSLGCWGNRKNPKIPPTPPTAEELAKAKAHAAERARLKEKLRQQREAEEAEARRAAIAACAIDADDDEKNRNGAGEAATSAAANAAANAAEGILSPKTRFATKFERPRHDFASTLRYLDEQIEYNKRSNPPEERQPARPHAEREDEQQVASL